MRAFPAVFLGLVLAAGVSCDQFDTDVDFLDVDALVAGVYTQENAAWFERNAENHHGLDCTASCSGFGDDKNCAGLHTSRCFGVHTGDKSTVHSKLVTTCLGAYYSKANSTKDELDVTSECSGLFSTHTFTGVTKNTTKSPENCHGHCSKGQKESHCGKHCAETPRSATFDAIVKSEGSCGLAHTWHLKHPLSEGASVAMKTTCNGVSAYTMSFFGKKDISTNEDLEAAFDREVGALYTADSSTILEKLSTIVASTEIPTEESKSLDTFPLGSFLDVMNKEEMNVTCNGKPDKLSGVCQGVHNIKRKGDKEHGGHFEEDSTCVGKHIAIYHTLVCQGNATSIRTDTSADGEVKEATTTCKGNHVFSFSGKGGGFRTICTGAKSYATVTTPPAGGESTDEPEISPVPEAEAPKSEEPAAEVSKPEEPAAEAPTAEPAAEVSKPEEPAAEAPTAEPAEVSKPEEPAAEAPKSDEPAAKAPTAAPTNEQVRVSLFKDVRLPTV